MRVNIGEIKVRRKINIGEIKVGVKKIAPMLENLEIIPTTEDQSFKSALYGFDNVTVKGIETEELNVTPSTEEQNYEGLYDKVYVKKIEGDNLNIIPSANEQAYEGVYTNVTVAGESNLIAENIKQGTSIFGVVGTMEGGGEENAVMDTEAELTQRVTGSSDNGFTHQMFRKIPYFEINKSSVGSLFKNYKNLTEINVTIRNARFMNNCFQYCEALLHSPVIDTSEVTYMGNLYSGCKSMISVPLLEAGKVTIISYAFSTCSSLLEFGGLRNLGKAYTKASNNYYDYSLDLHFSELLTHESLMNVINNLYDLNLTYNVANGGTLYTQKLQLGSTNLAKLTAEEISICTSKGWSVS